MPTAIEQAKAQEALQALGVTPQAIESIRRAPFQHAKVMLVQLKERARKQYRKLALELHPDRTGGDEAKTELFKMVSRVLEDFQKLEVRPPAPQPRMVQVMFVQPFVATSSNTSSTTTASTGTGQTWVQWNAGGTTTVRPNRPGNPRHVVNMRP